MELQVHHLAKPQGAQLVAQGALSAALSLVKGKEEAQGRLLPASERRELILEVAQALLPRADSDQALSLTFAAMHAQKDLQPLAYRELADHVTQQANALEARANKALNDSTQFVEWNDHLSHLGEEYSVILDVAQELALRGTISVRANGVLQSIMEPPTSGQGAHDMYTKAMAICAARAEEAQPARHAMRH